MMRFLIDPPNEAENSVPGPCCMTVTSDLPSKVKQRASPMLEVTLKAE